MGSTQQSAKISRDFDVGLITQIYTKCSCNQSIKATTDFIHIGYRLHEIRRFRIQTNLIKQLETKWSNNPFNRLSICESVFLPNNTQNQHVMTEMGICIASMYFGKRLDSFIISLLGFFIKCPMDFNKAFLSPKLKS